MIKTCSKCSREFTCKNEARGCWCEEIETEPAVLQLLQKQYDNCLCPDCLAEFSVSKKQDTAAVTSAYDAAHEKYFATYKDELEHKPLVKKFITDFCKNISPEETICDMGCGPGQVAHFITEELARKSHGIDLSPQMIAAAEKQHPHISFEVADIFQLKEKNSFGGIIALYFIVNFPVTQLPAVFSKLFQLLKPGGKLLLSFHIGEDHLFHAENFLESGKGLDFYFFRVETVEFLLSGAGFRINETRFREPYPDIEFPSRRAYIFAEKPAVNSPVSG